MPGPRPSLLRTTIGRAAVAGAATLVTVTGFAPTAMAADDLAPESGAADSTSESGSGSSSATAAAEQESPASEGESESEQGSPSPAGSDPAGGSDGSDTTEDDTAPTDGPTDGSEQPPAVTDDQDDADDAVEKTESSEAAAAAATELTLASDSATVVSGRTVSVDVLGNDSSTDVLRSLTIEDQGEHGTGYVVGSRFEEPGQDVPGEGSLRIEFDADTDYVGADTLTYRVTTQDGTTETATVAIDVEEYVAPPVEANFGSQKIRIGVQQADGSYLPEGTTTAGSVIRIEEQSLGGGAPTVTTCTTLPAGGTSSQCASFDGNPGSTYVITQVSAPTGVVASPRRRVVDPCNDSFFGYCFVDAAYVNFINTGSVLPEANDDSAESRGGDAVDIDVLANDDSDDPGTTLEVERQPLGGTVEVVGEADRPQEQPLPDDQFGVLDVPTAGNQVVRYTPEPGFEGIDDFTYRLTNGNGADTATVTVSVSDNGAVTPVDPDSGDDAGADSDSGSGSVAGSGSGVVGTASAGLPSTGGPDQGLLVLGGALLVGGAAAVAGTRRRRDAAGA